MLYVINFDTDTSPGIFSKNEFFHDTININGIDISLILYFYIKKNTQKAILEDLKNTVSIAFRDNGFIFVNFNKKDQDVIYDKVINYINMDKFNRELLKSSELYKNEIPFPFVTFKDILNNLNRHSFFRENKIVLTEKNIQKVWEIKNGKDKEVPVNQNTEKLIIEEVDKYQEKIYAYVLCKDNAPTDYKKLAGVESDPNDFISMLINYKLSAEGLAEKHSQLTKANQKITTLFFDHIETVKNEPKAIGVIMSSFVDGYTLILCFNEKISSGILMGMISTIEKKLKGR